MFSSQADGLTAFHCYLQSLPPCLCDIEHILLQRHNPTTPMRFFTTGGRFCAVKASMLFFLLSLSNAHTQTRTLSKVAAVAAAQITLSLLSQSDMHLRPTYIFLNI